MKKKKLLTVASAALCTVLLSSCGGGSRVGFSANWYANTTTPNVLEGTNEKLSYSVSLKNDSGYNTAYSVIYADGATYETSLTDELRNGELVYRYETALNISLQYAIGSEVTEKFDDKVTSTVWFKSTQSGLRPVASEKRVLSHSPASMAPTSLKENICYRVYDYNVSIEYDENASSGTCTFTDYTSETPQEKSTSFSVDTSYSYIDNAALLFAIRGMSLTSSQQVLSQDVLYNGASLMIQTHAVKITPSSETSEKFGFKLDGADVQKAISYYPVSIVYSKSNPGSTQTAWYAKTTESNDNANRNVMLRLETPLSYQLGTLVYTLESAEFTK